MRGFTNPCEAGAGSRRRARSTFTPGPPSPMGGERPGASTCRATVTRPSSSSSPRAPYPVRRLSCSTHTGTRRRSAPPRLSPTTGPTSARSSVRVSARRPRIAASFAQSTAALPSARRTRRRTRGSRAPHTPHDEPATSAPRHFRTVQPTHARRFCSGGMGRPHVEQDRGAPGWRRTGVCSTGNVSPATEGRAK
jgi:hypothetical protein